MDPAKSTARFVCLLCGKKFKDAASLKLHFKDKHMEVRIGLVCKYCTCVSDSEKSSVFHENSHHRLNEQLSNVVQKAYEYGVKKVPTFECSDCEAVFADLDFLRRYHAKECKEARGESLLCVECGLVFNNVNMLDSHVMKLHRDPLKCKVCNTRSESPTELADHMVDTHTARLKEEGYFNVSKMPENNSKVVGLDEFRFRCQICGYRSSEREDAISHAETIHLNCRKSKSKVCMCVSCITLREKYSLYYAKHPQAWEAFKIVCRRCKIGFLHEIDHKSHNLGQDCPFPVCSKTSKGNAAFMCVPCGTVYRSKNALKVHYTTNRHKMLCQQKITDDKKRKIDGKGIPNSTAEKLGDNQTDMNIGTRVVKSCKIQTNINIETNAGKPCENRTNVNLETVARKLCENQTNMNIDSTDMKLCEDQTIMNIETVERKLCENKMNMYRDTTKMKSCDYPTNKDVVMVARRSLENKDTAKLKSCESQTNMNIETVARRSCENQMNMNIDTTNMKLCEIQTNMNIETVANRSCENKTNMHIDTTEMKSYGNHMNVNLNLAAGKSCEYRTNMNIYPYAKNTSYKKKKFYCVPCERVYSMTYKQLHALSTTHQEAEKEYVQWVGRPRQVFLDVSGGAMLSPSDLYMANSGSPEESLSNKHTDSTDLSCEAIKPAGADVKYTSERYLVKSSLNRRKDQNTGENQVKFDMDPSVEFRKLETTQVMRSSWQGISGRPNKAAAKTKRLVHLGKKWHKSVTQSNRHSLLSRNNTENDRPIDLSKAKAEQPKRKRKWKVLVEDVKHGKYLEAERDTCNDLVTMNPSVKKYCISRVAWGSQRRHERPEYKSEEVCESDRYGSLSQPCPPEQKYPSVGEVESSVPILNNVISAIDLSLNKGQPSPAVSHRLYEGQTNPEVNHRPYECQANPVASQRPYEYRGKSVVSQRPCQCQANLAVSQHPYECQANPVVSQRPYEGQGNSAVKSNPYEGHVNPHVGKATDESQGFVGYVLSNDIHFTRVTKSSDETDKYLSDKDGALLYQKQNCPMCCKGKNEIVIDLSKPRNNAPQNINTQDQTNETKPAVPCQMTTLAMRQEVRTRNPSALVGTGSSAIELDGGETAGITEPVEDEENETKEDILYNTILPSSNDHLYNDIGNSLANFSWSDCLDEIHNLSQEITPDSKEMWDIVCGFSDKGTIHNTEHGNQVSYLWDIGNRSQQMKCASSCTENVDQVPIMTDIRKKPELLGCNGYFIDHMNKVSWVEDTGSRGEKLPPRYISDNNVNIGQETRHREAVSGEMQSMIANSVKTSGSVAHTAALSNNLICSNLENSIIGSEANNEVSGLDTDHLAKEDGQTPLYDDLTSMLIACCTDIELGTSENSQSSAGTCEYKTVNESAVKEASDSESNQSHSRHDKGNSYRIENLLAESVNSTSVEEKIETSEIWRPHFGCRRDFTDHSSVEMETAGCGSVGLADGNNMDNLLEKYKDNMCVWNESVEVVNERNSTKADEKSDRIKKRKMVWTGTDGIEVEEQNVQQFAKRKKLVHDMRWKLKKFGYRLKGKYWKIRNKVKARHKISDSTSQMAVNFKLEAKGEFKTEETQTMVSRLEVKVEQVKQVETKTTLPHIDKVLMINHMCVVCGLIIPKNNAIPDHYLTEHGLKMMRSRNKMMLIAKDCRKFSSDACEVCQKQIKNLYFHYVKKHKLPIREWEGHLYKEVIDWKHVIKTFELNYEEFKIQMAKLNQSQEPNGQKNDEKLYVKLTKVEPFTPRELKKKRCIRKTEKTVVKTRSMADKKAKETEMKVKDMCLDHCYTNMKAGSGESKEVAYENERETNDGAEGDVNVTLENRIVDEEEQETRDKEKEGTSVNEKQKIGENENQETGDNKNQLTGGKKKQLTADKGKQEIFDEENHEIGEKKKQVTVRIGIDDTAINCLEELNDHVDQDEMIRDDLRHKISSLNQLMGNQMEIERHAIDDEAMNSIEISDKKGKVVNDVEMKGRAVNGIEMSGSVENHIATVCNGKEDKEGDRIRLKNLIRKERNEIENKKTSGDKGKKNRIAVKKNVKGYKDHCGIKTDKDDTERTEIDFEICGDQNIIRNNIEGNDEMRKVTSAIEKNCEAYSVPGTVELEMDYEDKKDMSETNRECVKLKNKSGSVQCENECDARDRYVNGQKLTSEKCVNNNNVKPVKVLKSKNGTSGQVLVGEMSVMKDTRHMVKDKCTSKHGTPREKLNVKSTKMKSVYNEEVPKGLFRPMVNKYLAARRKPFQQFTNVSTNSAATKSVPRMIPFVVDTQSMEK